MWQLHFSINEDMRILFYENKELHDFMMLAHYTTNYSEEEYQGLKQFEFPFSHRRFMELTGLPDKKLRTATNELLSRNKIEWTEKSKSKYKPSKMKNLMAEGTYKEFGHSKTIENTMIEDKTDTVNSGHSKSHGISHSKRHSKTIENTMIEEKNDTVNDIVKATVNDTLSNKYISNKNKSNIYISEFEAIWKLYPRKEGKAKARESFIKLRKKHSLEELQRAVERYKEVTKDENKKYIKHASTFFNGGYEDYLDENYTEVVKDNTKALKNEKPKPNKLLGWDDKE